MRTNRLLFIVLFLSGLLFQCQYTRLQDDPGQELDDSNQGTLNIKIPGFYDHLTPPLQSMSAVLPRIPEQTKNNVQNFSQPATRVYASNPTRIDFRLRNSDGDLIYSWTITTSDQKYLRNIKKSIPAGLRYTLEADIYNSFVSDTDILFNGLSKSFDVFAGGITSVEVFCTLVNPVKANHDTVYPVSIAPCWYDLNLIDNPFLRVGGEQWYAIERSAPITTFELIPDSHTVPLPGFFYKYGDYGISYWIYEHAIMEIPGKPMKLYIPGVPNLNEAYLVVMGASPSNGNNSTISWKYYPGGPADTDEPNDSYAQAIVLPVDTEAQGFCFDEDYYKLSLPTPGKIQIRFQNTNSEEELSSTSINIRDSASASTIMSAYLSSWMIKDYTISFNATVAGDYYLILSPSYSGTKYIINWTMES